MSRYTADWWCKWNKRKECKNLDNFNDIIYWGAIMTITITKIKYQYQSKYAHTFYVEFVVLKYKTQSAGFSSFFPTRYSHYNVFFFLLFTWYSIVVIALLYFCTWKIQFISRRQSTVSKSRPLLVIAFYFLWNINFLRFSFSIRCSYNFCIILPLPTPCHSFRR